MRDMKCNLGRCTLHYETRGDGRPFVLLHGGGPDRRSMIGCMEPVLKKRGGWRRIYPDLPGMGRTGAEEWIMNSDNMLDIIIDFINTILPNQHFVLAGDSYGGYLTRGIVYRMLKKVDGLLLICPVIEASHAQRTLPRHVTLVRSKAMPVDAYPKETDMFGAFAVVQTPKIFERTRKEILSGLRIANIKFLDRIELHGYPFTFDVDSPSIILRKPTLILAGRQDSMVGYHDCLKILENYPRATFAVLDRAGHNLHIEQTSLFNALVNEWLTRVEEERSSNTRKT